MKRVKRGILMSIWRPVVVVVVAATARLITPESEETSTVATTTLSGRTCVHGRVVLSLKSVK